MAKILVVGSFVMDFIYTTEKFPAVGETVLGKSFANAPGGKGANQAVQCAKLGAEVTMLGKLGKDSVGDQMIEEMKKYNIDVSLVARTDEASSAVSSIQIEQKNGQSNNSIIVISGANMTINDDDIACLKDRINEFDMVIMQFEIPLDIVEKVAVMAHEAGVPVMLNPAPAAKVSDKLIANIDYIAPNEVEAKLITGVEVRKNGSLPNMDDVKAASKVLLDKGCKNVIITLGDAGVAFCTQDGKVIHSPIAPNVHAVDPTAAGDSFIGAFCTYLASGMEIEAALKKSNYTAGCTVQKMGAMPSLPSLEEVEEFMGRTN